MNDCKRFSIDVRKTITIYARDPDEALGIAQVLTCEEIGEDFDFTFFTVESLSEGEIKDMLSLKEDIENATPQK